MKVIIGTYRADKDMICRAVESINRYVSDVDGIVFIDDSGNWPFVDWLQTLSEGDDLIQYVKQVGMVNQGYAKAMQTVCNFMANDPDEHFVFWEEDFVAVADVDLYCIRAEMEVNDRLAQIVLPRQPWFENEIAKGSMLTAMEDRLGGTFERYPVFCDPSIKLLRHQMTFSCNPAVWGPLAYQHGWPQCNDSEDAKTQYLVRDDNAQFAFWGDKVLVHHDGERSGHGY